MLSVLPLSSLLYFLSCISTHNKTGDPSGVLGASLALCITIIYILNCVPGSPINKALFLVIIISLIVFRNCHEKMLFRATPYPRSRSRVTGYAFTTKLDL